jgi:hypothetical protein
MPGVKRFRRFILNAATWLSLLLSVGTVCLWVRSYWKAEVIERHHEWHEGTGGNEKPRYSNLILQSDPFGLIVERELGTVSSGSPLQLGVERFHHIRDATLSNRYRDTWWNRCGLYWIHVHPRNPTPGSRDLRSIGTPHWLPALVLSLLPLFRLIRHLRRRSLLLPGHCLHCGYDLRATPSRCPECGTIPTNAVKA